MREHKPKTTETSEADFLLRLEEFSAAIHNYGVGNLFSDLKSHEKITTTYSLDAFRQDFKKMKSDTNGFLNNPALIGEMCEIIKFPASALFGGPTTKAEDSMEIIKAEMRNMYREMEKDIKIPNKRIYNNQIIAQGARVYSIIHSIIYSNRNISQEPEPIRQLFIWYSANDKTWDHNREPRIKQILEYILNSYKGSVYINSPYNFITSNFGISEENNMPDYFWNYCLIIAYQLSCIEKLYSVHLKSKHIKSKEKKGIPTVIFESKIKYAIHNDYGQKDIFSEELRSFCKAFDTVLTQNNYDTHFYNKSLANLKSVIINFQELLIFLLNPVKREVRPQGFQGSSPIYIFTEAKPLILESYELIITDRHLNLLQDNCQFINSIVTRACSH
jgi:hypothetical protein